MQRISRAPELSATFSLDSCWIIGSLGASLLGALEDLGQAPVLGLRHRPGLDQAHGVAGAGLVALVVRVVHLRAPDDLLVGRVTTGALDADGDRLVHLVRDDGALADLRVAGLALGLRGALA